MGTGYFYVPEPVAPKAAPAHQQRVDDIVTQAKRERAGAGDVPSRPLPPPPLKASEALIELRTAEELQYVQRLLERMSDELSDNSYVLDRFAQTLQGFDLASQILGHLAKIVSSQDKDEAAQRIGMDDLRRRLTRKALF